MQPAPDVVVPRPTADSDSPLTPVHAHDLTAVRTWARSRGFPVDESGELPPAVVRAYRQVHRC